VAPFDGVHGWYWLNDSQQPVLLRLQIAGFYEPVVSAPPPPAAAAAR